LGIDLERLEDIPSNVWDDIVSPEELRRMSLYADLPPSQVVNLAFTVKEAYFKAQCPITGDSELEFRDVELAIDPKHRRLALAPIPGGLRAVARLRWGGHWCVAAVALRQDRTEV